VLALFEPGERVVDVVINVVAPITQSAHSLNCYTRSHDGSRRLQHRKDLELVVCLDDDILASVIQGYNDISRTLSYGDTIEDRIRHLPQGFHSCRGTGSSVGVESKLSDRFL